MKRDTRCRKCRQRIAQCGACRGVDLRHLAAERAAQRKIERMSEQIERAERDRYLRTCARMQCGLRYDSRMSPSIFFCGEECEALEFSERKRIAAEQFTTA